MAVSLDLLTDSYYPAAPDKFNLSFDSSKNSDALLVATHPPSEWPSVPIPLLRTSLQNYALANAARVEEERDELENPPSSSPLDLIVEAESEIKSYAAEHPGDHAAIGLALPFCLV
ncbi:hypothetical protein FLAG1_04350 [Fusarium langsethiae]|uniref:Uncharacterized protein n=1 Tax=Fusarium langsethiae TaxID=179993 RepID=A0A0N0DFL9_FUSLA|nr:hypothetical protein FLAG1_04350 [Fusarium langsethiae]GKU06500.1 unnamed protein product [Fusarium langsethiae]GKU11723.1 unnamed protein product [Fusarium langsethiae]